VCVLIPNKAHSKRLNSTFRSQNPSSLLIPMTLTPVRPLALQPTHHSLEWSDRRLGEWPPAIVVLNDDINSPALRVLAGAVRHAQGYLAVN